MSRFRVLATVLRTGSLRSIAGGHLLFAISEAATWLAILFYAHEQGGPTEVGVVAVAQLVPPGLVAPFSGFFADRRGRVMVLTLGYVAQALSLAATTAALALDADRLVVYVLAAVASAAMAVTRPSIWSLLPWVVSRPAELTAANVAGGLAESFGLLLGPLGAGLMLSVSSVTWVYGGSTLLVVVAALLASRLDVVVAEGTRPAAPDDDGSIVRLGLGAVLRSHTGAVIVALAAGFVVMGAVDVAAVLVADELAAGDGVAGYLAASSGVGAVLGAATSVLLVGRRRLLPPLLVGVALVGGAVSVMGWTQLTAVAVGLFVLNGIGAVVVDISGRTLIQRSAAEDVLAAVFGLLEGLTMLFMAVGAFTVSMLVDRLGIGPGIAVTGLVLPVVVVLVARWLVRVDRAAEPPDADLVELILGVEFLSPLPSPVVEQLALNMTPITVAPGEMLIEQGGPGDYFYLVESGRLRVERNGSRVAEIGAGGFVGEIALLDGVLRTATVTTVDRAQLRAVDREVFVEAVTGHPQSHAQAAAVTAARQEPDGPV